jgi:hypothetical protein
MGNLKNGQILVEFADEGQDFLRWVIEDNVIIDCQPFQGWLWNGKRVLNAATVRPGMKIIIQGSDGAAAIIHPVASVTRKPVLRGGARPDAPISVPEE